MTQLTALALCITLALCHSSIVEAADTGEQANAGPYVVTFGSGAEKLEPGSSSLLLTILLEGQPLAGKDVWVRLSDRRTEYLASTFVTDENGRIPISYHFNGPGYYTLDVRVDGYDAALPVHVHGQYLLLFGFLAALFIVIAFLLDRM